MIFLVCYWRKDLMDVYLYECVWMHVFINGDGLTMARL